MGLDMYLRGTKVNMARESITQDGFPVTETVLQLGYWRKHPNLHGFIVETFAKGVDECQEIPLSAEDIQTIIDAVRADQLPQTSGFFFGHSDGTEKKEDLEILNKALQWLKTEEPNVWRSVHYRANW